MGRQPVTKLKRSKMLMYINADDHVATPNTKCPSCGDIAFAYDKTPDGIQRYFCNFSGCIKRIFTLDAMNDALIPKKVKLGCLAMLILIVFAGFIVPYINNREIVDEVPEPLISMDKFWFASGMSFRFRMAYNDWGWPRLSFIMEYINPRSPYFDPFYTDLIFVHSEEDAKGFPENIITAWPCELRSQHYVDRINRELRRTPYEISRYMSMMPKRDVVYVEDYGLTYPISITDFVDNWINIIALWRSLRLGWRGFTIPGERPWQWWYDEQEEHDEQEEYTDYTAPVPIEKFLFARDMRFIFRMMVDGNSRISITGNRVEAVIRPDLPSFNPFYTDLVFVHNEAEAAGFPNNVIVAWPWDNNWTYGLLEEITLASTLGEDQIPRNRIDESEREVLNVADFGLSYPITITDLIENWESMNALWQSFTIWEQYGMQSYIFYREMAVLFGVLLED